MAARDASPVLATADPTKRPGAGSTMRRAFGIVTAFGAAVSFVVAGATAASADSGPRYVGDQAKAWFKSYGEHLYIKDTQADGHSAVAQIAIGCPSPSCTKTYWNPNGEGTTRDVNLSIADGTDVWWRVCLGEYSNYGIIEGTCTSWEPDTA